MLTALFAIIAGIFLYLYTIEYNKAMEYRTKYFALEGFILNAMSELEHAKTKPDVRKVINETKTYINKNG
jgi:hypothetical protein